MSWVRIPLRAPDVPSATHISDKASNLGEGMTSGTHDTGGGFGRSAGANLARGIGVIVIAIAIGLLLMNRGLGERVEAQAPDDVTTTTAESGDDANLVTDDEDADAEADVASDDSEDDTSTTTAAPATARPAAEVTVLVLNGTNGLKGVAGRGSEVMSTAGYLTAAPKNADIDGASVILYMEGFEADARAIATAFGVDPDAVVQPFDAASSPIADTQGANVVVRIGNDGVILV